MADESSTNSLRRLDKVTFTPLVLPESEEGGGALELAAAATQLGLVPGEATLAIRENDSNRRVTAALEAFDQLAAATSPDSRLAASGALARMSNEALIGAVSAIRSSRERALNKAISQIQSVTRRYVAAEKAQAAQPQGAQPAPGGILLDRTTLLRGLLANAELSLVDALALQPAALSATGTTPAPAAPVDPALPPRVAALIGGELAPKALAAMRWADKNDPGLITELINGVAGFIPETLRTDADTLLLAGLDFLIAQMQKTADVKSHLTQRKLQSAGLLHLEQLVMTPIAIERGELLYTLPLAPGEKVTLSHKEWTLREEEYSRFIQDYFENYSERGVAEKTDIGVASRSETEHSKTLSMGKPMVPGAATIADPVNTQTSTEEVTREQQSEEQSRRQTQEITQKSSALSVRDQKVSFTVSTVSGTEDFTSRLYKNKHTDKVMLVDYFRRMRRWRNDLFRTGIRLTYDVVLPDPGRILRERWLEVKALDDQIAAPFLFEFTPARPSATSPVLVVTSLLGASAAARLATTFPRFDFDTASVADLDLLARSYGATLPAAPDQIKSVEETHSVVEPAVRNEAFTFSLSVNIPAGYQATKAWIGGQVSPAADNGVRITCEYRKQTKDFFQGVEFRSLAIDITPSSPNTITGMFTAYKGAVGNVRVWAEIEPTADTWRIWRDNAWNIIRQAARTRYNEKRDRLIQQRTALLLELEAPDTLGLRRMEREQVMYLVLRWLFPDFESGSQIYRDAAHQKAGSWQPALEYGEYIKFVHQAIDWDNALVVLYPYFWDNPENHASKLYLNHPDSGHREFLRSGAARVILAIRSGYEEEVVSLLDNGVLGKLTPGSRFLPIIEKVRAANERLSALLDGQGNDDPAEGEERPAIPGFGERIGRWVEWTPTSALDMEVRLRPIVEE